MKKILISPLVNIYETDESGINYSPLKNRPRTYSGGAPTGSGSGSLLPQNNDNNYLLLETGFFLLQEDGSKIIL